MQRENKLRNALQDAMDYDILNTWATQWTWRDKPEKSMTKAIKLNGVEYLYSVCAGRLYKLRDSGLPCAGMVQIEVKRGTAAFNRVLDAIIAA